MNLFNNLIGGFSPGDKIPKLELTPESKSSKKTDKETDLIKIDKLADVPPEIKGVILSFNSELELEKIRLVSKEFYKVSKKRIEELHLPVLEAVQPILKGKPEKVQISPYRDEIHMGLSQKEEYNPFGKFIQATDKKTNEKEIHLFISPKIPKEEADFQIHTEFKKKVKTSFFKKKYFPDTEYKHTGYNIERLKKLEPEQEAILEKAEAILKQKMTPPPKINLNVFKKRPQ